MSLYKLCGLSELCGHTGDVDKSELNVPHNNEGITDTDKGIKNDHFLDSNEKLKKEILKNAARKVGVNLSRLSALEKKLIVQKPKYCEVNFSNKDDTASKIIKEAFEKQGITIPGSFCRHGTIGDKKITFKFGLDYKIVVIGKLQNKEETDNYDRNVKKDFIYKFDITSLYEKERVYEC
tara:strand:- start:475 stop:1011 length:537 start_codon:yes stop_codon:yes gene_type:complete